METVIIGVDPGLDGGFAALTDGGVVLRVMPTLAVGTKRAIDEQALVHLFLDFQPGQTMVFLESVGARPGQGVTSMFSFGLGFGVIRGVLAGLGFPYELVRPQEWQREMLTGQPKGSEYATASRLWPNTSWTATPRCSRPHSGLVDAALIAEYGRRRLGRFVNGV